MRSLAHIEQVLWKRPIEGKDRIELIGVLGWQVIAKKDEFQVGDKVIYVEIDSILPEREEFEFLRDKKFRIRTLKMAGVLSQGIVFPISLLGDKVDPLALNVGDDVTQMLGVTKYEPELQIEQPAVRIEKTSSFMTGIMKHCPPLRPLCSYLMRRAAKRNAALKQWPGFISKTDETRVQNMPWIMDDKDPYIVTEKIDGQSGTFFVRRKQGLAGLLGQYEFGVCSRNFRLPEPDNSSYWNVAKKYGLKDVLIDMIHEYELDPEYLAIQGEVIGPGIQKNKYSRTEYEMYVFNLISSRYGKINSLKARTMLANYGVPFVPIIADQYIMPDTVDELLQYATGESELAPTLREGIVLRNYLKSISFKAVSNEFLLKWKE